jgi:2-polyprenyl-6-methoxyphenol hydroxylase-like FAD-dependent oxidoreductase
VVSRIDKSRTEIGVLRRKLRKVSTVHVVVVGAGLGGMAAAVGLNRSGHEVTVCERADRLRETGTGILIAPNGVRALEALGLGAYASSHVLGTASGGLRDWRGRPLLVADMAEVQEMVGAVAMVSRPELLQALRAPLPDGLVHTGMPVERLEQDDTGVWVTSGGRRVARADLAVVADGISSVLRPQLFAGHPGLRRTGRLDLRGMLATPDGLAVDGLLASNLVDRRTGSEFGLYPVGADRLYWFTDTALRGAPPAPEQARRDVLSLMADWHPAVPALIEATSPADIYVDPIACLARPLPSFAVGRIALLGDAAHAMPPDLGQGASQAFEDAAALARHLDGADPADVPERLRRYDAQRRPPANRLLRQAQRMSRLTAQTGTRGWLRDVALRAVPSRLAARQAASAYGMTKRDPRQAG